MLTTSPWSGRPIFNAHFKLTPANSIRIPMSVLQPHSGAGTIFQTGLLVLMHLHAAVEAIDSMSIAMTSRPMEPCPKSGLTTATQVMRHLMVLGALPHSEQHTLGKPVLAAKARHTIVALVLMSVRPRFSCDTTTRPIVTCPLALGGVPCTSCGLQLTRKPCVAYHAIDVSMQSHHDALPAIEKRGEV
jgi:hypothetical protein